ncbi:flavodoxin [Vibrio sp. RC27]
MSKIGIFFGSETGKTQAVAQLIHEKFASSDVAEPVNINTCKLADLMQYDALIVGTPTLGEGELPGLSTQCESENWEEFIPEIEGQHLSGKKVALFGLGDQVTYPEEFVDGLGELFDLFADTDAEIVGSWPSEGYTFEESTALDGDEFVGLVIDQDNQADQTDARVTKWVSQLKSELGL